MCLRMVESTLIWAIFSPLYCYICCLIHRRCHHTSRLQSDTRAGEYDRTSCLYDTVIYSSDEGDIIRGEVVICKKIYFRI
jgi:hypothetical protein